MTGDTTERDERGRFADGNPGGPGRPKRATELAYMRALSDELPMDTWREIVRAAVNAARDGDAQARAWISRYTLGETPATFTDLAKLEALSLEPEDLIEAEAELESAEARGEFGDEIGRIFRRERPATLTAAVQRRAKDTAARQAEEARARRKKP
jgi:hypothetical protein